MMTTVTSDQRQLVSDLKSLLAHAPHQSVAHTRSEWFRLAPRFAELPEKPAAYLPVGVVGDPPIMPPIDYHLDCLSNIDWFADESGTLPTKVHYHLQMLASSISPDDPELLPSVSVVIPVHNGRAFIERSIRSVLAQGYPNLEIVVVDDGSTDGTSALVASMSGPIHLIYQQNCGAAEARNRGIREATGDLVHFLDADDELLPGAIKTKALALVAVPDARLCYSHYTLPRDYKPTGRLGFEQFPLDDVRAATGDALLATSSRFPFQASTVLAARWFLQQVGPFDADLKQSEDTRYWFRMARLGLKAVAIDTPLTRRHPEPNSLTEKTSEAIRWAVEADLRCAQELAKEPRQFRYLVCILTRATWLLDRAYDAGVEQSDIEQFHGRLLELERTVGNGSPSARGLTAILLDQLVFMLRQKRRHTTDKTRPMIRLWHEREMQLLDRLSDIEYVTGSDLRRWLPNIPPRRFSELVRSEQIALKFALEQLQISLVLGELPLRFRSLERVAADYVGHPYENYWKSAFRLARVLGDDAARGIFRRKFFRDGWQVLGRARKAIRSRLAV